MRASVGDRLADSRIVSLFKQVGGNWKYEICGGTVEVCGLLLDCRQDVPLFGRDQAEN